MKIPGTFDSKFGFTFGMSTPRFDAAIDAAIESTAASSDLPHPGVCEKTPSLLNAFSSSADDRLTLIGGGHRCDTGKYLVDRDEGAEIRRASGSGYTYWGSAIGR